MSDTKTAPLQQRHPMSKLFGTRVFPVWRISIMAGLALTLVSCATWGKREGGALIGAGTGAVVGGVIGNNTGSTARGAIIGAAVGGAAGAIIGHQMDQQAKELKLEIPGATIERVGEGITVTFASGLMYDFDSDGIRAEAGVNLQNLAASLKKYPNTSLLVVGHTDASGSADYNQGLSLRRANAAMSYLGRYGVGASRVSASGRGEMEPVTTNDTESGRQLNRRIEVAIYANAASRAGN
jgi:outer membrane protein OmpA-like peptidoglycan-associated protein